MLASKALLTTLNISQWTGYKYDKRATTTVEASFATQAAVGNYNKKLLPGAVELEEVRRVASSIRAFFYEQTLPWFADGTRIISSKNYMSFVAEFRTRKQQFDRALNDFLTVYPKLRREAEVKLGDLFNAKEYPTESQLRRAFSCDIAFMPLPDVADFRTEIAESEKEAFVQRMQDVEAEAMKDCWNRLHEVVSKAAERLQEPEAKFRDSLIENIQDICSLLPRLNITDDPKLEAMRKDVEKLAAGISPKDVRTNSVARANAARKLDEITNKMSAFMGGS